LEIYGYGVIRKEEIKNALRGKERYI